MTNIHFINPESSSLLNLTSAKVMLARMLVIDKDDSDNDLRMIHTLAVRVVRDLYDSERICNNIELLAGVVHKMYHNPKLNPKTALGCLQSEMEAHAERLSKLTLIVNPRS